MTRPFVGRKGLTLFPSEHISPSTRLAFKLFQQLRPQQGSGNLFFSPASVTLCLCMLREGSTGETQEAMDSALEIDGLEPEALQSAIASLRSALQIQGSSLQLEMANSLWCNPQWAPRSEYVAKVREAYGAEVFSLDSLGAEMVAKINSWVAAKTRGNIDGMVSKLDPLTSLAAINAIYFKDVWREPFYPEFTREDSFHTADGRKLKVPLMNQSDSYPYYEESKFQAVRLRYKTSRLGMYVFLPAKRSTLAEFKQNFTSAAWDGCIRRFETVEGHIRFPRFKLTYESNLYSALASLGMGIAFDSKRARFDAIHSPPPPIWIDQVLHRAFVEVNEEGTEAAAVTTALMFCASARNAKPPRTFEMVVDRPFFFAIYDDHTRSILFMGAIEQPHS
jgi:serine protease inhibitor